MCVYSINNPYVTLKCHYSSCVWGFTNLHPTTTPPPTITIDDKALVNVEHFKYLGSTRSCDGSLDREIDCRISKASQALDSLRNRVLSEHNIRLSTKLKVYNAVVLPSFLYGCETWTLYRRHIKKLEFFHMRALRSIQGIRWQDHITNLEFLDQAKSTSIEATIIKAHLWWVGHVIRMEECRLPRRLMYGELLAGKRNQGRPKLRYKDTVKANLQWCRINPRDLEGYAMDRPKWRRSVHRAAANFEEARYQKLTAARERHRRASSAVIATDFQCPHCSRLCASGLGPWSHLRVHRWVVECKRHYRIRWTTTVVDIIFPWNQNFINHIWNMKIIYIRAYINSQYMALS